MYIDKPILPFTYLIRLRITPHKKLFPIWITVMGLSYIDHRRLPIGWQLAGWVECWLSCFLMFIYFRYQICDLLRLAPKRSGRQTHGSLPLTQDVSVKLIQSSPGQHALFRELHAWPRAKHCNTHQKRNQQLNFQFLYKMYCGYPYIITSLMAMHRKAIAAIKNKRKSSQCPIIFMLIRTRTEMYQILISTSHRLFKITFITYRIQTYTLYEDHSYLRIKSSTYVQKTFMDIKKIKIYH